MGLGSTDRHTKVGRRLQGGDEQLGRAGGAFVLEDDKAAGSTNAGLFGAEGDIGLAALLFETELEGACTGGEQADGFGGEADVTAAIASEVEGEDVGGFDVLQQSAQVIGGAAAKAGDADARATGVALACDLGGGVDAAREGGRQRAAADLAHADLDLRTDGAVQSWLELKAAFALHGDAVDADEFVACTDAFFGGVAPGFGQADEASGVQGFDGHVHARFAKLAEGGIDLGWQVAGELELLTVGGDGGFDKGACGLAAEGGEFEDELAKTELEVFVRSAEAAGLHAAGPLHFVGEQFDCFLGDLSFV